MRYIRDFFTKHFFFIYTFIILFLKSVVFLGLQINLTHSRCLFSYAAKYIFLFDSYRSVFYIGFILIPLSLVFLFKNRMQLWFLLAFNFIVSILLVGDMWYLRSYNSLTTVHLIAQSNNLGGLGDSIISLIKPIDVILIFDIPVLLTFILIKKDLYKASKRSVLTFAAVFLLPLISMLVVLPAREAWNRHLGNNNLNEVVSLFDSNVTADNISPIGYHFYDIYAYFRDTHPKSLSQKEKDDIKAWFKAKEENLPDNKYKGMFKGKNLIILQVESLEKFVINQKINDQEITPNLNRLIKNGLYFTNYYEQINNGMSSDADLLTNTSIFPIRSGSTFFRYPYTKYNSLPLTLRNMGYSTYAYHPDMGSFWNWLPALKSIGFEKCTDASHYDLSEVIGFGISDNSYFRQVEPMIKSQKTPFYSFVVTLSGHMPFKLPDNEKMLKLDETLDKSYLGGYFQCANYEDRAIGSFLDMLKKDDLLDNSLIVIYGDHEGIHRFYPEDVKNVKPSQDWWLDNHKNIPLIIYNPSLKAEEISTIGGQIDLYPTVAYLLGVDQKELTYSTMGKNLLNTSKSFAVMENRTIICDKNLSEKDKTAELKGLDIATSIIRSNYFKK